MLTATFLVLMVLLSATYHVARWIFFDAAYDYVCAQRTAAYACDQYIRQQQAQTEDLKQHLDRDTRELTAHIQQRILCLPRRPAPVAPTPITRALHTTPIDAQSLANLITRALKDDSSS